MPVGRLPFTRAEILADPRRLLEAFESVGENCEFGFLQRQLGVEPLGLLRWAGSPYKELMTALANDFAGVGDPEYTRFDVWDGEYVIFDTRYGLRTHTWITPRDVTTQRFMETACTRLRFLVRKFREDAGGERVLVRASEEPLSPRDIRDLHHALRRYGPNVLLHVTPVGDRGGANAVDWLDDGLMVAGIHHLGHKPDDSWDIPVNDWMTICRKAFLLHDMANAATVPERGEQAGEVQRRAIALVGEVAADRRPAVALRQQLLAFDAADDTAAAAAGTALFESIFYRLPVFPDDDLPRVAARLYARAARPDPAFLLDGLAKQTQPPAGRQATPAATEAIAARAATIIATANPGGALLLALEALEHQRNWQDSALLFEAVWPNGPPLLEYWVYHRMSQVYEALDRADASVLLAMLAIQIQPRHAVSDAPHRRLLRYFRDQARLGDAADLCLRRQTLCPDPALLAPADLAALLAEAGPPRLSPPPAGRRDRVTITGQIRPASPWRAYGAGLPIGMEQLWRDMERPPISVAALRDAEVLIDRGAFAVFGADGGAHDDLWVREFPSVLRRQLARPGGMPVEELMVDQAILISDYHFDANLCHFLLDHATRIEVYRRAGVDIEQVVVIGPPLAAEYQHIVAQRLGVRAYLSVSRRARLEIGRLWVSSNCHGSCHPGHWTADWAINSIRSLFDLGRRGPPRRLLVSRADAKVRRLGNEAEVLAALAPRGFERIVPGEMPFLGQVAAFRDATHVVAPHGAALANTLFSAPGTHVLEMFHPQYATWAYAMLGGALGLDYASMVGRDALSDAPEFNDPNLPREHRHANSGRDMRADMDELRRWLTDTQAC